MFPDGNDTEVGERYNFRKLKLPADSDWKVFF